MINGRSYGSTAGDLDTIPLSAVERIEILGGEGLGAMGGSTVAGAINIVLRTGLEGFETRAVARRPSRDGGDGTQGSVFWSGAVGSGGRMTLGVDLLDRQEITARSREYSRSEWKESGSFRDARNVSVGGNTVWVVDEVDDTVRTVSLGDCSTANGYTGPLKAPPGTGNAEDEGCGYAYGNIMWNSGSFEQKSAILNFDHPFGDSAELHLDANLAKSRSAFRYAPSVGVFSFTPNQALITAIDNAGGQNFDPVADDDFSIGHRFVGHGNRDWYTDNQELDGSLGIEGRLAANLGYDASVSFYHRNTFLQGDTFVHRGKIAAEIAAGNYNLVNPFSTAPAHAEAIRNSSVTEENDSGADYLGIRLALEGTGSAVGDRDLAWTAGVELERVDVHRRLVFLGSAGEEYDVTEVLGSGGTSYEGDRKYLRGLRRCVPSVRGEAGTVRVGGRRDEADDVGGLASLESRGRIQVE